MMDKFQYLAGIDIKVGTDAATLASKVNAFFAIPAVATLVIGLQFIGLLIAIWKLGGPALSAVFSRNWKTLVLDTGALFVAIFIILSFQFIISGIFTLVDLFKS